MSRSPKDPDGGKVPDAVIASIKNNTSFLSLLKSYGIEAAKKGKGHFAICPFHTVDGHAEAEPSLSVDPTLNLYHCFSCNARGNVIQFVMEMEKATFPAAVEKLLALRGGSAYGAEHAQEATKGKTEAEALPLLTPEERQTILKAVMQTTTDALRSSEAARKYLEGRGLDPLKLLESYSFGYWNCATYANLDGGERKKLAALGLVNVSGRPLFENCVIFPLAKEGRVTTLYGRKADATSDSRHYLLPCKREGLYLPRTGLDPRRPLVITESIIDALSLFSAGSTNVLPLLGVNGFLPDHLDYLRQHTFAAIYIALNGDEAGNKAAAQLKRNLAAAKLPAAIITLPDGKDVNDMLIELGPDKLQAWFRERTGATQEKPTVWEDEAGTATYALFGDREYRLQGLSLYGMDRLRANIKVCRVDEKQTWHLDTLDLYQSKSREHFVEAASKALAVELHTIASDVNGLITLLEELRLRKKDENGKPKVYAMSDDERNEALAYLRAPDLLGRIAKDFASCGMVGNRNACLLAYLGGLSRLTERPFGTLIVSRSGAGKSFLQEMVADFTPEESLLRMTRLTGQSLFYQRDLRHKLLTIEEDEGMQEAMYSVRTLLSSQKLTLQSLKTDPKTGEFKAYENTVVGPASVMISTTNLAAFTFENANRFFTLFLDESREQTAAILKHQLRTAGLERLRLAAARKKIERLHRNIQRLLKPVMVVNRIGTGIEYPAEVLNTRREQTKTGTLIDTVTLLHQYQREVRTERVYGVDTQYIEVTREDLAAVHEIAGDVLRQSLDETPKLCRDLLGYIHELVNEKYKRAAKEENHTEFWRITFTRKELQEKSGWSRWHLEEHLKELEEAGYIVHRIGGKGQRYAYSLVEETLPALPEIRRVI